MLTALNDLGKWLFKTIQYAMERIATLKSWLHLQRALYATKKAASQKATIKELVIKLEVPGSDFPVVIPIEGPDSTIGVAEDLEGEEDDEATEDIVDEILEEVAEVPKIPVTVALGVTISWIFIIASLFLIWETNWTFGDSTCSLPSLLIGRKGRDWGDWA